MFKNCPIILVALMFGMLGRGLATEHNSYRGDSERCAARQEVEVDIEELRKEVEVFGVDIIENKTGLYRKKQLTPEDRSIKTIAGLLNVGVGVWGLNKGGAYGNVTGVLFLFKGFKLWFEK